MEINNLKDRIAALEERLAEREKSLAEMNERMTRREKVISRMELEAIIASWPDEDLLDDGVLLEAMIRSADGLLTALKVFKTE